MSFLLHICVLVLLCAILFVYLCIQVAAFVNLLNLVPSPGNLMQLLIVRFGGNCQFSFFPFTAISCFPSENDFQKVQLIFILHGILWCALIVTLTLVWYL